MAESLLLRKEVQVTAQELEFGSRNADVHGTVIQYWNSLRTGAPFVFRAPGNKHNPSILCIVSKAGSSSWGLALAKALHIHGFPGRDGAFRKRPNGLHLGYHTTVEEFQGLLANSSVPKYMLVRSPHTRLLSGYLHQVVQEQHRHRYPPHFDESTGFSGFVDAVVATPAAKLDLHFRLQSEQCGIPAGLSYRYLQVEHTAKWYDEFICQLSIQDEVASGWNISSRLHHSTGMCFIHKPQQGCSIICDAEHQVMALEYDKAHLPNSKEGHQSHRGNITAHSYLPTSRTSSSATSQFIDYYDASLVKKVLKWAAHDMDLFGY